MKITINTEILKKHGLSLGEFLLMLIGYYDLDFDNCHNSIIKKYIAEKNVFKNTGIILSNNSKDLVAQILMESDDKAIKSNIDFEGIAEQLMNCYPEGNKPGTTHSWRSTVDVIAQKLRTLVVRYDFTFTAEEAVQAVTEYLSSFEQLDQQTLLLKSFILRTTGDRDNKEMESLFMSYIENIRDNQ